MVNRPEDDEVRWVETLVAPLVAMTIQSDWNRETQCDSQQEKCLADCVCKTVTKDVLTGFHDDLDRNKFSEQAARR